MIDITTVTQVNSRWIFTKNGERIKSTAENVRDVWEQAKIKHMMYNIVIDDLRPVRENVLHKMQCYLDKSNNSEEYDILTRYDNQKLAQEFLHKLDGVDISIEHLRTLADHYYSIEIQAHNVLFANRW